MAGLRKMLIKKSQIKEGLLALIKDWGLGKMADFLIAPELCPLSNFSRLSFYCLFFEFTKNEHTPVSLDAAES